MATQVQNRRGTTAEHATFTGAVGEVTVDTTKDTVVVHDGSTAGGAPLLREDQSNLPTSAPTTGLYNNSGALAISTSGTGRLFVDASGNVSVGSALDQAININRGEENAYLRITNANITGYTGINHGAGTFETYISTAHPYRIVTNNQERLRITSDGKLGVGTSGPGAPLTTQGFASYRGNAYTIASFAANSTLAPLNICQSENGTAPAISAGQNSTGTYQPLVLMTSEQKRVLIDASGNVGVGTANPDQTLHIESTNAGGSIGVRIKNTGTISNTNVSLILSTLSSNGGLASSVIRSVAEDSVGNCSLSFLTPSAGNASERARIDSSGRLLVGTSTARSNVVNQTPDVLLEKAGGSILSVINNQASANDAQILLGKTRGSSVGSNTIVQNGDALGLVAFCGNDGTSFREAATIRGWVEGTPGANDMPGRLVFSTNGGAPDTSPTERMKITSTGQIIGVTETNHILSSERASSSTDFLVVFRHSATSLTATGTNALIIRTNGNVENAYDSYGGISDIKLKENIVDAGSQWDDFKAVRFRKYNFKEETGHETFTQLGVIAQELEQVCPRLVTETPDLDEDGNDLGTVTKSVKYSILTKKALVALQEAMERIETLEAEVAALKAS